MGFPVKAMWQSPNDGPVFRVTVIKEMPNHRFRIERKSIGVDTIIRADVPRSSLTFLTGSFAVSPSNQPGRHRRTPDMGPSPYTSTHGPVDQCLPSWG